jgi:2-methylcitrate dehydratase PrpD
MSATLIFGHAAHTGLRAALLAKEGLTGPSAPLEGKFGFLSLFASKPNPDALNTGLGKQFEIEQLAYKPYPCGVVIHPAVDAALTWHCSSATPQPEQISEVVLQAHPSAGTLGFRRHPANELEAKVSLFHWIAAALTFGKAGLSEGRFSIVEHPMVHRLREVVNLVTDENLDPDSAIMTVKTRDGNERKIAIDHCIGSVANPMSDANLSDKFMQQALMAMPEDGASELLKVTWKIDELKDLLSLTSLAGCPTGHAAA